jgi:hypothetical protein
MTRIFDHGMEGACAHQTLALASATSGTVEMLFPQLPEIGYRIHKTECLGAKNEKAFHPRKADAHIFWFDSSSFLINNNGIHLGRAGSNVPS